MAPDECFLRGLGTTRPKGKRAPTGQRDAKARPWLKDHNRRGRLYSATGPTEEEGLLQDHNRYFSVFRLYYRTMTASLWDYLLGRSLYHSIRIYILLLHRHLRLDMVAGDVFNLPICKIHSLPQCHNTGKAKSTSRYAKIYEPQYIVPLLRCSEWFLPLTNLLEVMDMPVHVNINGEERTFTSAEECLLFSMWPLKNCWKKTAF